MATLEETLRSLGLSAARGIPQLATGFVDLAALPFTATGLLKPEQAVGSTAYLTSKGLLPPEQQGLLNQTTELLSGAINPAVATKAALVKGGLLATAPIAFAGATNTVKPLASIIEDATKSGVKLDLYEKNGVINLSRIEVPKELRNSGIGSNVMNQIVNYADSTGNKVALTPSTDFGASSVSRLKDFYNKFGFVENKGKNKDFSTRETMYRNPQDNINTLELYHGTSPAAAKAIEKSGFDINKAADGTVWFTSNPNIGEVAASNKGAVVKRLLDKNNMKLGGWAETDKYSTDELINMGYDGLMLKDGDAVTYQIFNPQKLIKR